MINAKAIGLARARDLHQTIISGTIYNMWPEIIARHGLWYNSNEYSINSRLFEQPLMEYIYLPEEY